MVSVKVDVNDGMKENVKLMQNLKHIWPEEYWKLYKKNVAPLTPAKGNWLRRSIRHSVAGNELTIWWEAKYAAAQDQGYHVDKTKHFVPSVESSTRGRGFMAMPGRRHVYWNYTTPGTGAGFRQKAADMTKDQFVQEFYKNHPEYR